MIYLYYIAKTILVLCYLATIHYGWIYFFAPVIALNGGANFAATWFSVCALSILCAFLFVFMPRPTTPQATYKDQDHAKSQP